MPPLETCSRCGEAFTQNVGPGRPRKYCSVLCAAMTQIEQSRRSAARCREVKRRRAIAKPKSPTTKER